MNRQKHTGSPASFVDELQENGRYSFTLEELRAWYSRSDQGLQAALGRLKQRGRIISPRSGFYVIVPIEYKNAGCPPASWFVNELMRFLAQPYYVGILSAAAIHGAAHQQPMAFQVITDRPTRQAVAARVRIDFHINRNVEAIPVAELQTETGYMRVSTPNSTAFDLVRYAKAAGNLGNVGTVLSELAEVLDAEAMVHAAPLYAAPDAQRLGYLLNVLGYHHLSQPLADWLSKRRYRKILLSPGQPIGECKLDQQWKVLANVDLELDL